MNHIKAFQIFESTTIIYPSMEEVKKADHYTICKWYRYLSSPGSKYIGKENFHEMMEKEGKIMDLIVFKFKEGGGFTSSISKSIGWD